MKRRLSDRQSLRSTPLSRAGRATWLAAVIALAVAPALLSGSVASAQQQTGSRAHVEHLASDELGGRLTGTEDAAKAAEYIIAQLEGMGAQPLVGQDGFRMSFEYTAGVNDGGSRLEAIGSGLAVDLSADSGKIRALSFTENGEVSGPVVFAGYGMTLPESAGYPYDSFATLDVEDKIVVVLRYVPEDVDNDAKLILNRSSDLRYKAMRARELGAKGLLVVTGPRSPNGGELVRLAIDGAVASSGIIAASITGDVAEALFAAADKNLADIQAELDSGNPHVVGFDFPGVEMTLTSAVEHETRSGYNVVGYLPPSDSTAPAQDKPYVMIGAHYDHLGRGSAGNSLSRGDEVGEIHNGADDNASGVAAVLEAAVQLSSMSRDRGIVVAFWSGEELGLLGAGAFVDSEVIGADELAAYINFDMVGRSVDNIVTIQAVGSSDAWPGLIERTNVPIGFDVRMQEDPWLPTDSMEFNLIGVPSLSFFTGTHEQYHRPSDDPELINYEDLDRIARFGALLARRVANAGESPAFVSVPRILEESGSRDTARATTGTIPDYAAEAEGLLLSGVIEGGPADEAGLQGGDVIVEFAGQTITNIYDYMAALEVIKVDVPVKVVFVRDGERHEIELTPRARQ